MYKFNLNHDVTIEIKENSLDIIKSKISGDAGFKEDYMKHCITPRISEFEGKKYLTLQLWEIMSFFGDELHLGVCTPIGTDIYFDEEHCVKDNTFKI